MPYSTLITWEVVVVTSQSRPLRIGHYSDITHDKATLFAFMGTSVHSIAWDVVVGYQPKDPMQHNTFLNDNYGIAK